MAISWNKAKRLCDVCRKPAKEVGASTLQKCAQCKCAMYCGSTCQRRDWPLHKPLCKRVKYLTGLEGEERLKETAKVVQDLRTEAIENDDAIAGLKKFLFAYQVETVFGEKRVFQEAGKQFAVAPSVSHPAVITLKAIQLNVLHQVHVLGNGVTIKQAKSELLTIIHQLESTIGKQKVAGVVAAALNSDSKIPQAWRNAFVSIFAEDPTIQEAVLQAVQKQEEIKPVKKDI